MSKARKAIAAALVPVVAILLSWAATGALDTQELAIAISGALATVLVYFVPNDALGGHHEDQADPEEHIDQPGR